jgi:hypothetical protein
MDSCLGAHDTIPRMMMVTGKIFLIIISILNSKSKNLQKSARNTLLLVKLINVAKISQIKN